MIFNTITRFGGWAFTALLLTLAACDKHVIKPGAGNTAPPKLEPTLQSVQTVLINTRCLSCHTEPTTRNRNVGLANLQDSIEKPGHHHHGGGPHPRTLIKPGCPKQSFFLTLLKQGKMPPPPDTRVSDEDLKTLEAFIVSLDPKAGKMCDDEPPDLECSPRT